MSELAQWLEALVGGRKTTQATQRVLEVLRQDPGGTFDLSAQKVADRADVNVASVVRAAQFLGFRGWPALKHEIRHRYLATLSTEQVLQEHAGPHDSPARASLDADMANLKAFAAQIDLPQIRRIAELISKAGRTFVMATGSYAAPGAQLSHVGQYLGHDIELHTAMSTGLVSRLRLLRPGDCVVSCAVWRSTAWILEVTKLARERGASIVVIADRRTALSDLSNEAVIVPSEGVSFVTSMTAAMSATQAVVAELAALDTEATVRNLRDIEGLWRTLSLVDPT
ncbi:MurR/RpiR family transcriptional regulator [Glutamicibacter halophytocola]|uniref:MurR/RpiR family transcriptional regulator n=1 Tax=Glutamicibacter halophytocola TaxID=1933880 RepID=A0AA94XV12_9MICC|nr:MurR/RpiR family transcriptional regulator [Glutamicibacter halophytocola]UUX60450.1 MurR/RpiR family transcriptional regulator [Glutamicibacter halophytocola]